MGASTRWQGKQRQTKAHPKVSSRLGSPASLDARAFTEDSQGAPWRMRVTLGGADELVSKYVHRTSCAMVFAV